MLLKNLLILSIVLLSTAHDSSRFNKPALTVNGYPLNYDHFTIYTRGDLKLLAGNPGDTPRLSIPFWVMLRREGTPVGQWSASRTRGVYSLLLNELWPLAQVGDELVIEPIQHSAIVPEKQIIKLKPADALLNWVVNLQTRDKC